MSDAKQPGIEVSAACTIMPIKTDETKIAGTRLRLYVARSTPNSIRAEQNLAAALNEMADEPGKPDLEIVDVFTHPKRAINDSVMVTPTLIGIGSNGRHTMIGDMADEHKLKAFLQSL